MVLKNLITYQSIALEKFNNSSFESDSIGWSIRPQIKEMSRKNGETYNWFAGKVALRSIWTQKNLNRSLNELSNGVQ